MKSIKDLREQYNLITEKEEAETKKLAALVRAGLFDAKKLTSLKRALDKPVDKMTAQEKRMLLNLLDALMSEVLSNQPVYQKVKQNVMKESVVVDTKDYLTKMDPRVKRYGYSQKDAPSVLLLKRKAIRVFPDGQKVALYYAQAIDKYVSIPFSEIGINETWLGDIVRGIVRSVSGGNDSSSSSTKKDEDEVAKELKPLEREKTKLNVSSDLKDKPYITGVEARRQKYERDANMAMAKGVRESFKSNLQALNEFELGYSDRMDDLYGIPGPKQYGPSGAGAGAGGRISGSSSSKTVKDMIGKSLERARSIEKKQQSNILKSLDKKSKELNQWKQERDARAAAGRRNRRDRLRPNEPETEIETGTRGKTIKSDVFKTIPKKVDLPSGNQVVPTVRPSVTAKNEPTKFPEPKDDKVLSDVKDYLRKRELEKNIKSDTEREARYKKKVAQGKAEISSKAQNWPGAGTTGLGDIRPTKVETPPYRPIGSLPKAKADSKGTSAFSDKGIGKKTVNPYSKPAEFKGVTDIPDDRDRAEPENTKKLRGDSLKDVKSGVTTATDTKPSTSSGDRISPTQEPSSQPRATEKAQGQPWQGADKWKEPARSEKKSKPDEEGTGKREPKDTKSPKPPRKPFKLPALAADAGAKALTAMTPGLKLAISGPKREGDADAIRSRLASYERRAWQAQAAGVRESVEIDLNGNRFVLNNEEANKVISLYESLNTKNKQKMIKMMNESEEQLNKIVSFAVRQ